jgi:hypothetical protein
MKKNFFYLISFIIVIFNTSIALLLIAEEVVNKIIPAAQAIQELTQQPLLGAEDQAGTLVPQVITAAQEIQELAQHPSLLLEDQAGTQVPQLTTAAQEIQELAQDPSLLLEDQAGTQVPQVTAAAQVLQEITHEPSPLEGQTDTQVSEVVLPAEIIEVIAEEALLDQELEAEEIRTDTTIPHNSLHTEETKNSHNNIQEQETASNSTKICRNSIDIDHIVNEFKQNNIYDEIKIQYVLNLLENELELIHGLVKGKPGNIIEEILEERDFLLRQSPPTIAQIYDYIMDSATETAWIIYHENEKKNVENNHDNPYIHDRDKRKFLRNVTRLVYDVYALLSNLQEDSTGTQKQKKVL